MENNETKPKPFNWNRLNIIAMIFLTVILAVTAILSANFAYKSNKIAYQTSVNQLELAFESLKNEISNNIKLIPIEIMFSNDSALTFDFYITNNSAYGIEEFEFQIRYNNVRIVVRNPDNSITENGFGQIPDSLLTISCKDPFSHIGNDDNTYPIWVRDTTNLNRPFFNKLRKQFQDFNSNTIPSPYYELNSEIRFSLKLEGIEKRIIITKVYPISFTVTREPTYFFPK